MFLCSTPAAPKTGVAERTEGGTRVKDYEAVYIFDTRVTDEAVGEKLERYHKVLADGGGVEVTVTEHWGRRQFAYPIDKQTAGNYVVVQFRTGVDALPEYERLLKLDEELLRHLVVSHEGEPATPMSIATRSDRKESDEDDDEDEA
jgi:small subunit ribosomal protein S6